MCEMEKSVVELHDISASIMEVLLDFVYTETVNVSVENVQDLLPAACLLQLTGLLNNPKLIFIDSINSPVWAAGL